MNKEKRVVQNAPALLFYLGNKIFKKVRNGFYSFIK